MMTRFLLAGALLLAAAGSSRAELPNVEQNSSAVWKAEDNCAREAFHQFPDYTAESNAKRNRAMRRCLDRRQLPPRADLPRPTPRESSGSSMPRR